MGYRRSGNLKEGESVRTDVVAKVCAGKDADAQVLLHLADDLDSVVDGEM